MKIEPGLVAALAALFLPLVAHGTEGFFIPPILPAEPQVTVSFSIPRYTLGAIERETVAACLVLEAASQGEIGLRGVMAVIRNRAHAQPELFAPTVLRDRQFSALNSITSGRESLAHAIARAQRDRMWLRALSIVDAATADSWSDPTDGATHYTRSGESNRWTRTLARTVTIGAHAFYRERT